MKWDKTVSWETHVSLHGRTGLVIVLKRDWGREYFWKIEFPGYTEVGGGSTFREARRIALKYAEEFAAATDCSLPGCCPLCAKDAGPNQ